MARIIVADDDPGVRGLLTSVLERNGYEVSAAENGREALKMFRQNPADLVVTDIFMPEGDGLEAIAALQKDFPGVKIIAISGGGRHPDDKDYLATAKKFGATMTFPKPLDMKRFVEAVGELLAD